MKSKQKALQCSRLSDEVWNLKSALQTLDVIGCCSERRVVKMYANSSCSAIYGILLFVTLQSSFSLRARYRRNQGAIRHRSVSEHGCRFVYRKRLTATLILTPKILWIDIRAPEPCTQHRGRSGMGIIFLYAGTWWVWRQEMRGRLGMETNYSPRAVLYSTFKTTVSHTFDRHLQCVNCDVSARPECNTKR